MLLKGGWVEGRPHENEKHHHVVEVHLRQARHYQKQEDHVIDIHQEEIVQLVNQLFIPFESVR